jgi:glycerate kinase
MKILIAPDSFKGTLTAAAASAAIAEGIQSSLPSADIQQQPIADGGEGTVDVVLKSKSGTKHAVQVTGPLGEQVRAAYAILEDATTTIIEMAAASGLMLVPPDSRNIMRATTFGTGELIADALDRGVTHILVGLGGSATCDGGLGFAQALGFRFMDADGKDIPPRAGAIELSRVACLKNEGAHPRLSDCRITALCDVRNPLVGANGSARIFAPQKGASPEEVRTLDNGLAHWASVIEKYRRIDVRTSPFGGAAGGLAAGLAAFANAELVAGADAIFDLIDIEQSIADADAVITGEGRLDATTLDGKALLRLAATCHRMKKPLFALIGQLALPPAIWQKYFAGIAELGGDPAASTDHAERLRGLAQSQASAWFSRR